MIVRFCFVMYQQYSSMFETNDVLKKWIHVESNHGCHRRTSCCVGSHVKPPKISLHDRWYLLALSAPQLVYCRIREISVPLLDGLLKHCGFHSDPIVCESGQNVLEITRCQFTQKLYKVDQINLGCSKIAYKLYDAFLTISMKENVRIINNVI